MPPHIRELLDSVNQLTVDAVSQPPFVLEWGDPRGPQFFYAHAREEGYSALPVRQGRTINRIVETRTLANVATWESTPVGRPLEVDDLVARDAPLFSLLQRLERRELLMCLGRDGIDGVVTIYDLNQPAAHMFAFGLALFVEAELSGVIAASLRGDGRCICRHVQGVLGAKHHAVKRWKREADAGEQIDLLSYLTFYEKTRCLTDESLTMIAAAVKVDAEEARRQLREVRLLRNNIAHYAEDLADFRTVGERMTIAYRLARRLAAVSDAPTVA